MSTTMVDLGPAALRMAELVSGVGDEQLDQPTPCVDLRVADLVDHVGGLALAFTDAAEKTSDPAAGAPPIPDGARLRGDWRSRTSSDLAALADAWRSPAAWSGTTRVGGVDLPGAVAGVVALDELVLHGWDLARATGRPFSCDDETLQVLHQLIAPTAEPGQEASREGLFGPVVPVPDHAPLLDRVLGLAGRDPAWRPR